MWLETKLNEWRHGQDGDSERGTCTKMFMESYQAYAMQFPKDYGRRFVKVSPQDTEGSSSTGFQEQENSAASISADAEKHQKDAETTSLLRKGRQGEKTMVQGSKGPNYDVLSPVDGLVKTSSGRYIKNNTK